MQFILRTLESTSTLQNIWTVCVPLFIAVLWSQLLPRKSDDRHPTEVANFKVAMAMLREKMISTDTYAIFIRLAWSDAATYDKSIQEWPRCGGANGSIRFDHELDFVENRGLIIATTLLESIKDECPSISWADLIQMSGVVAIELLGGPKIDIKYGRIDAEDGIEFNYHLPTRLPRSRPPYADGSPTPECHIRRVFYRMGLTNRDLVALSGAHTVGRAFKNRSGVCGNFSGDQGATKYTQKKQCVLHSDNRSLVMAGGKSWTMSWLRFDNSYFKSRMPYVDAMEDNNLTNDDNLTTDNEMNDLIWLPSDQALIDCPEFRVYFIRYAENLQLFFHDYTTAHKKMSELGCKFMPAGGFYLKDLNE